MKKLLLVGQFTDHFRKINKSLTEKYEVRACVNKLEIFKGMFKLNKPDIVVMLLQGLDETNEALLKELKKEYKDIPVVCAGIDLEDEKMLKYLLAKQFEHIKEPYTVEELIEKIEYALIKDISEEENQEAAEKETEEDKKAVDDKTPIEKKLPDSEEGKKSILVVDDSGIFLRMMKGLLEEKYDVIVTTSGLKAITIVHEKKPDLILLDYEMPLYDGRETMMKIRESEDTKDIPIVFVTAVNDKEHIKVVLSQKPAAYLLKPLDKDRLLRTIKEIIGE